MPRASIVFSNPSGISDRFVLVNDSRSSRGIVVSVPSAVRSVALPSDWATTMPVTTRPSAVTAA
jgi:hypothetical protein